MLNDENPNSQFIEALRLVIAKLESGELLCNTMDTVAQPRHVVYTPYCGGPTEYRRVGPTSVTLTLHMEKRE